MAAMIETADGNPFDSGLFSGVPVSTVVRVEAKMGRLGGVSLIRTAQWSLMTLWPSGGQQRSRSNALVGTSDDGYAEPSLRRWPPEDKSTAPGDSSGS
jgi:hypothetical protein